MKRAERRAAWRAVCKRKGLPPGTTARDAWLQYRMPGSRRPFAAHVELTNRLDRAAKIEDRAERLAAVAALRPLRHRGHGGQYRVKQRTIFGRTMTNRSKY